MIYRNFTHHQPDNSFEKNKEREREREREREIHVLDPGLYSNLGSSFLRVCTLDFKHKDKRKMEENSFSALLDNGFKNNKKRRHKGKVREEKRGAKKERQRERRIKRNQQVQLKHIKICEQIVKWRENVYAGTQFSCSAHFAKH